MSPSATLPTQWSISSSDRPDAGLEPREGDGREAPQGPVVGRGLAGVAHPELDAVDALERQEVLGLRIGILVDVRAGLVRRGAARWAGGGVGHSLAPPVERLD